MWFGLYRPKRETGKSDCPRMNLSSCRYIQSLKEWCIPPNFLIYVLVCILALTVDYSTPFLLSLIQGLEKDLDSMDIKIGLLVKNRIDVEEVVAHGKHLNRRIRDRTKSKTFFHFLGAAIRSPRQLKKSDLLTFFFLSWFLGEPSWVGILTSLAQII